VAQPLMPHATASWLVENTSLTFEQIAQFCGLHILEVQAIADDTAATKLTGRDPIRDRSHWNIANIQPKDPVTLGLCSQRELDALVAKAAKQAGIEAQQDTKFDGDREALIEELRREREAAARDAEAALAAEDAEPGSSTGQSSSVTDLDRLFKS
jgi:hypothetical protein